MPLVKNKNAVYSDIDLSFEANPRTGDIVTLTNDSAVSRALQHSLFFNKFDIPFDPYTYSSIKKMLFEPINFLTSIELGNAIRTIIKKLEPTRINIRDLIVKENHRDDGYDIELVYDVRYYEENVINKLFLKRIR